MAFKYTKYPLFNLYSVSLEFMSTQNYSPVERPTITKRAQTKEANPLERAPESMKFRGSDSPQIKLSGMLV